METKNVQQYYGKLTPKKAEEGIAAAIENAVALYDEALLLFQNKRYARAFSLAILCIEEVGKVPIIKNLLLETSQESLTKTWKRYRKHSEKNLMYDQVMWLMNGYDKYIQHVQLLIKRGNSGIELDKQKQEGFYSDAVGKCEWISPQKQITPQAAKQKLEVASLLTRAVKIDKSNSAAALEIWIKHMKPHYKKDVKKMGLVQIDIQKEMIEKGLVSDDEQLNGIINHVS